MKGVLLAGGAGSRLQPSTSHLSKHLLPIYDKPMIYYSLSTLMLAGIREILIVVDPSQYDNFVNLLGDGKWIGLNLSYAKQAKPGGVAQGILIASEFLQNDTFSLALGDNFFYGAGFVEKLIDIRENVQNSDGAEIFALHVSDPKGLGVIEFDNDNSVQRIEEKPENPKSNFVIPGIYFYDKSAVGLAETISVSWRGELEITDLNNLYLSKNQLRVKRLGRGFAWFDMGTVEAMAQAINFVQAIQAKQGILIGSLEEIAYNQGWISKNDLALLLKDKPENLYYNSLRSLFNNG